MVLAWFSCTKGEEDLVAPLKGSTSVCAMELYSTGAPSAFTCKVVGCRASETRELIVRQMYQPFFPREEGVLQPWDADAGQLHSCSVICMDNSMPL